MGALDGTDPKKFITDFFTSFMSDLARGDEDPTVIVDRYHTPDIVQVADGNLMDRAKLIAHTRPARKHQTGARWEVHEAIADEDRIAARYTLHFQTSKREGSVDVHFFGQFAADGRMRRAHMLTRSVPAKVSGAAPAEVSSESSPPEAPDRRQSPA
ncbi:nuclear transport factor 2 family protein [Micromonospora sp. PSH03]|uniref:nuclear transport factor 2 family protein n=1 Tax=Micromonospora TaxID=1873 RepID=UPI001B373481|nr:MULTISPECIES: nuclear transport factor 2 family protein [Micromonospora]MBQ0990902.1 nuclear transport factor 2 family protein [Micromonospora sp. H61]MCG5458634.1 nuclear transport factor 2 family protein [Micromonospora salmantinae]